MFISGISTEFKQYADGLSHLNLASRVSSVQCTSVVKHPTGVQKLIKVMGSKSELLFLVRACVMHWLNLFWLFSAEV